MAMESLVTFAVEGLLSKLTLLAAQEIGLAWGFKDEIKRLQRTLPTIKGYLEAVAKQPPRDQALVGWVKQLKDIAHDAVDVLDDFNYELLRRKVEIRNQMGKKVVDFFSLSNPVAFRRLKMAHRIRKINKSFVELKNDAAVVNLVAPGNRDHGSSSQGIPWTNSLVEKSVGREEDLSDIVQTLTSSKVNQQSPPVMAIVGMGGLGKTTLAKSICNDVSIKKYFGEKMIIWVCVSDNFDGNLILRRMLEVLNLDSATYVPKEDNPEALIKCLQKVLKDKRYLLVLDDVWNEDLAKWENFMNCLLHLSSSKESKIILTTRSAEVARITKTLLPPYHLGKLSRKDCWDILKDAAFPHCDTPIAQEFEEIGLEIAKRCGGVPLVAKVLGGLLRTKGSVADWEAIKGSSVWNLQEGQERIMPILRLSFDNLTPPALKQCFAYCSMFMKDEEIERSKVIQLWMAQGLLHPPPGKIKEMEDIGNEYFDGLLHRSLFQDAEADEYGSITVCKMHDLVHDLAQLVSKEDSLTQDKPLEGDTLEVRHVARVSTSTLERIRENSAGRLHSLFSDGELTRKMLQGFKALRVLKLSGDKIQELPIWIGKLKHLRYLDISGTDIKEVPTSIGKLYNLQTLRAVKCDLKEFPIEVLNLINLRHIYFDEHTKFPLGIGQLKNLRTLPRFSAVKEKGHDIGELATLNDLRGELVIFDLEHVRDGDEARKSKLKEKEKLCHLSFEWSFEWSEDRSTSNAEDVLEGLEPHPNLESLRVEDFMGAKFPSWMRTRSMALLKVLRITGCRELIEWMEAPTRKEVVFPCLEELEISDCPKLKNLPSHFPSLKTLKIFGNEELTCLPEGKNLVSMTIRNCHKLTCITPMNGLDTLPLLQTLYINNCPALELIPQGMACLGELEIDGNEKLTCLPEGNNLVSMTIRNCHKLTCITPMNGLDTLPLLLRLDIKECPALELIPQGMASLGELEIVSCEGFSSGLEYCTSLQVLSIVDCHKLTSIPLHTLASLRKLSIENCQGLSDGLECCASLQELHIWRCGNLASIQTTALSNMSLTCIMEKLCIWSCGELSSLPALQHLPFLRKLSILDCPKLKSISYSITPDHLGRDQSSSCSSGPVEGMLEEFSIYECGSLQSIPDLHSFSSLGQLRIGRCDGLESLVGSSGLQLPVSLEELTISDFSNLQTLASLDNLTSLRSLLIYRCGKLTCLPTGLHCLTRLKTLSIGGFSEELDSFPDFQVGSSNLESLSLSGWPKLNCLPQQIQHLTSLTQLTIASFDGVEALPEWLGNLTSLRSLFIVKCKNVMHLPSAEAIQRLTNLQSLNIMSSPLLRERCTEASGPEWLKIAHIPGFTGYG